VTKIIEAVVHGIYVPIIVFAVLACYLLAARLILPAWRENRLDVDRYALPLSAALALAAHAYEAALYGPYRWFGWHWLNSMLPAVWVGKVLILSSVVMAVAAISRAATDGAHLARLAGIAVALWALSAVVAWVAP